MQLPKLKKIGRYAVCILLVAAVFLVYEVRLFQWQVLEGDAFQEESLQNLTDTIELEAARGQILDRNGNILAGNRVVYNVVYNALEMVPEERNVTIIRVVDLLEKRGETWRDVLPIVVSEEGGYRFAEGRENSIASLKEMLSLADYATAEDCMDELKERFNCAGFSLQDTRNVASVRYSMYRDGFSRTNPYVFARGVSAETVGVISQMEELKGIEVRVGVDRYYGEDGALAPHVVGFTGSIQDWQLEEAEAAGTTYHYRDNISGYKLNDTIGRSGLESAFEQQLRGQRGRESIYTDDTGAVKSTAVTVQPKEGNTVVTTLDSDLQRVANLSLEKNIKANTQARDCTDGAAVVLSVKDFGVLACSSYPTYDMNLYVTDDEYNEKVNEDKDHKELMFDRALDGVFAPGSVFKPMVALAALQEGTIGAGTTYYCNKVFSLGEEESTRLDLECTGTHGDVDVYGALARSCNVFFCNVGVNLTIRKMDAYAEYFGLGEKTGVELSENSGNMSNPQDYEERHGEPWLEGASAQTAIGQADNLFTPIQLATYCATMANGGKRLQTHFLERVTDYEGKEVLEEYRPVLVRDAGLSSDVLNVVKEGMISVASYGTASGLFADYPVRVACKTGTAETSPNPDEGGTQANISFICYAPADNPEIAVAVMLEHGHTGNYAQRVAKDILDQYFGFYTWDKDGNRYDQNGNLVDDEGKVLKTKEKLDQEKEEEEERKRQEFLASAIENGAQSTPAPAAVPTPTPSPSSGRGDIPNKPFTGGATPAPAVDATPAPSVSKPDSPYYDSDTSG